MIRGTKNFRGSDFDQREKYGLPRTSPPVALHAWAQRVLEELAQPIRDRAGALYVVSAYRSPEYNVAANGENGSKHMLCQAIDLKPLDISVSQLQDLVLRMIAAGELRTLGGLGFYSWGVHVDIRPKPLSGKIAAWDESATALNAAGLRYGPSLAVKVASISALLGALVYWWTK